MTQTTARILHNEQQKMVSAIIDKILKSTKTHAGIAIAPPGFGKTSVITACIDFVADRFFSPTKTMAGRVLTGGCLMLTPRLMLNEQQTNEISSIKISEITNHHKKVFTFDSDNSLSINDVVKFINTCLESNQYPIVVSTYDSADKLSHLSFDAIFCDEGHNVCSPQNFNTVMNILDPEAKRVFITATPRIDLGNGAVGVNERGMENELRYGKTVYSLSFKKAVKLGFILPLRRIAMSSYGQGFKRDSHLQDIVIKTMVEMKKAMGETPLPNKVIYVFESVAEIQILEKNWEQIKALTVANIYTAYSEENNFRKNGVKFNGSGSKLKKDFIEEFKKDKGDCILAHIDTMGEGVDVPGITGVIIFPIGDVIRIVQNIGRALRILPEDRNKTPEERIKKCALIGVVTYNDESSSSNFITTLCQSLLQMESDEFIQTYMKCDLTDNPAGLIPGDIVGGGGNLNIENQRNLIDFTSSIDDILSIFEDSNEPLGWEKVFSAKDRIQKEQQDLLKEQQRNLMLQELRKAKLEKYRKKMGTI